MTVGHRYFCSQWYCPGYDFRTWWRHQQIKKYNTSPFARPSNDSSNELCTAHVPEAVFLELVVEIQLVSAIISVK